MWDIAARVTYAFGFGERPPSAGGPGGPDDHDPQAAAAAPAICSAALGGGGAENKRVRFELFVVRAEPLNTRQPDRLLGRDDVAVLRPADARTGAEDRYG